MFKKRLLLFSLLFTLPFLAYTQIKNPVSWKVGYEKISDGKYKLQFNATISGDWHIYDLGPYDDGPNPTNVVFDSPQGYNFISELQMPVRPIVEFDKMFEVNVGYFIKNAKFERSIEVSSTDSVTVTGYIEWMVCDDGTCMPPAEKEFSVKLPGVKAKKSTTSISDQPKSESGTQVIKDVPLNNEQDTSSKAAVLSTAAPEGPNDTPTTPGNEKSIWGVIFEAIAWGFVALLTPCVFPMVPMTISFFLKQSQNDSSGKGEKSNKGKVMASLFGFSIIALYTIPIAVIILITYFAGGAAVTSDIFNWLATHWIPNVLFFIIFMVFAASFFGAFEIVLPSWMVNKSDSKSDKGGYAGVFFMALTLVLVSFSCTGPIVGTILIKSTQGDIWEPIITMFAFSAAFALPFTVFAFAPSLLKDLPKSGGWLNSVKVVLGFIEVALGFKFLSVADQVYHWGLLDREIYLAIWIVVFTFMGLYLLGKIRFSHDTPKEHISVRRLTLALATFTFVVYMIPGMWGAPLKGLSGYLPPMNTQDFIGGSYKDSQAVSPAEQSGNIETAPLYSDFLHLPHNLKGFFRYQEGMDYAKKTGKPVFIDFTGHGCVNCREMEVKVWSDPAVLKLLKEEFVIIALYADDKKTAVESDWVTSQSGRVLKSIGKINSHLALNKFKVNAQPYYVIINPDDETHLTEPRGYDLDVKSFENFLHTGLDNYKKR